MKKNISDTALVSLPRYLNIPIALCLFPILQDLLSSPHLSLYSLFLTLQAGIILFDLGLGRFLLTEEPDDFRFATYSSFITIQILFALFSAVLLFVMWTINIATDYIYVAFAFVARGLVHSCCLILLAERAYKKYAIVQLLSLTFGSVCLILVPLFSPEYFPFSFLVQGGFTFALYIAVLSSFNFQFEKSFFGAIKLLSDARFFVATTFVGVTNRVADRVFVGFYLGVDAFNLYVIINTVIQASGIFMDSLVPVFMREVMANSSRKSRTSAFITFTQKNVPIASFLYLILILLSICYLSMFIFQRSDNVSALLFVFVTIAVARYLKGFSGIIFGYLQLLRLELWNFKLSVGVLFVYFLFLAGFASQLEIVGVALAVAAASIITIVFQGLKLRSIHHG